MCTKSQVFTCVYDDSRRSVSQLGCSLDGYSQMSENDFANMQLHLRDLSESLISCVGH